MYVLLLLPSPHLPLGASLGVFIRACADDPMSSPALCQPCRLGLSHPVPVQQGAVSPLLSPPCANMLGVLLNLKGEASAPSG